MDRETANQLILRWNLTILEDLEGATCSIVLAGIDPNGKEIVLKVPHADAEEREALPALLAFSSCGGIPILQHDQASGATLMPRIRPGITLSQSELTEDQMVDVCADLILRLRQATLPPRPSVKPWFEEFQGVTEEPLVKEAMSVSQWLFETSPQACLLHGDFHHGNILQDGDDWIAVDPKGVTGDPAFEITGFMRNPLANPPTPEAQIQRIDRFASRLGDPPERLWGWSFCQTRLSAAWCDPGYSKTTWRQMSEQLWDLRQLFGYIDPG